jgi:hypothetical protein
MNWLQRIFGVREFFVSCMIQADDDHIYSLTFPLSVPKIFFDVTDEEVVKKSIKRILFIKKGIIAKEIEIIDCHII